MASTRADTTGVADSITPIETRSPVRGLLITNDPFMERSFRRELSRCDDCAITFDVCATFEDALAAEYQTVAVDLNGALPPVDAVRRARATWPGARIAVLSYWWSERDTDARGLADLVIHKPLRQAELQAFLRQPMGAQVIEQEAPASSPDIRKAG